MKNLLKVAGGVFAVANTLYIAKELYKLSKEVKEAKQKAEETEEVVETAEEEVVEQPKKQTPKSVKNRKRAWMIAGLILAFAAGTQFEFYFIVKPYITNVVVPMKAELESLQALQEV